MDPLTIVSLVSNIISFIDFGHKLFRDVREIQKSASGTTQNALSYAFAAEQTRNFINDLIPTGRDVDPKCKGIISLARECQRMAEDIQKLLDRMKPKDPTSRFQSFVSGMKGLGYGEKLSELQGRMDSYREQLVSQLNYVITSEVKRQMEDLAKDSEKNGGRIIMLQKQVEELCRTVETSDDRLSQGIQDLLQISNSTCFAVNAQRLLENLRFDGMNSRFEEVPDAHARTFEWIFPPLNGNGDDAYGTEDTRKIGEDFTAWLSSKNGVYHVSGKLGSGKSALMKFLYSDPRTQDLLKQWAGPGNLVMANFFFWKPGSKLQHSVQGLFRAILHQTLTQMPSLIPEILPEQWKEIQSKPWQVNARVDFPLATLEKSLSRLVSCQTEDLRICFFIDGLDECEESNIFSHRYLAKTLSNWCDKSDGRLKICASSREYNVFLKNLVCKGRLHMQYLTERDIRIYVHDRMVFLRHLEDSAELIESIIRKADGIFLWVALVTRRLEHLYESEASLVSLRKEIDQAPDGLYELFNHILKLLHSSNRARVFQTFAVIQKLGEYELNLPLVSYPFFIDHYTGDSGQDSCQILQEDRKPATQRVRQARAMLMGYCGGLFEATETKYYDYPTETIISYTHRSVPEFIESLSTKEKDKSHRGFSAEDAGSFLLLAYLWTLDPSSHYASRYCWWLSFMTHQIMIMRKNGGIGQDPFHFEENLGIALARLGVETPTGQDRYSEIDVRGIHRDTTRVVAVLEWSLPNHTKYYMADPFYVAAIAGNLAYVRWKMAHQGPVMQMFQKILLLYCLRYPGTIEEPSTLHQILNMLQKGGLSPHTPTAWARVPFDTYDADESDRHDVTVWEYLMPWFLGEMPVGSNSTFEITWRWLLQNGADPHLTLITEDEVFGTGSSSATLILGKEARRLPKVGSLNCFDPPVTSEQYPNSNGRGIRMTLIDIIRAKQFENGEEMISLVERNMRRLKSEPRPGEAGTKLLHEADIDEPPCDTSPVIGVGNVVTRSNKLAFGYEGKRMWMIVYILGLLSAVLAVYLVSGI